MEKQNKEQKKQESQAEIAKSSASWKEKEIFKDESDGLNLNNPEHPFDRLGIQRT